MSENNTKNSEDAFEPRPEYDFSGGVCGRFHTPQSATKP
jgi:hypothetical protein